MILRFLQKNVQENINGDMIVDDVVVNQKPQGRRLMVKAKAVVDVNVNRKLKHKERVKQKKNSNVEVKVKVKVKARVWET